MNFFVFFCIFSWSNVVVETQYSKGNEGNILKFNKKFLR